MIFFLQFATHKVCKNTDVLGLKLLQHHINQECLKSDDYNGTWCSWNTDSLSAVCHEISSLLLDETSQVLSVSYLRTNLSMLLHTICLKEKKSKVTILLKLRHDCHEKIWGLVIDSWQKTKPTAFSEIDTFFHRNVTQFRM